MISDRMDINRLMVEMRAMKAQSQAFQSQVAQPGVDTRTTTHSLRGVEKSNETPGFGDMLEQAVNKVNDLQKTSNQMASNYEKGIGDVDITDVMIASQKASVSFQGMLQVRNKLVEAYRDVMNMPV